MITFVPYAAFGYVLILCHAQAGDTIHSNLASTGATISGNYFWTAGLATNVLVAETGEKLEDRVPGWYNLENTDKYASTSGTVTSYFPVDSEWVCISHVYNPNGLPNVEPVIINPNESKILINGTNLFLVRGSLKIKDKLFVGPCQVRIRSGNVDATAVLDTTCYGLIFK